VTSNGNLNLCCVDFFEEYNFADLTNIDFKEAWNTERFEAIRAQHKNGNFDKNHLCYQCLISRKNIKEELKKIREKVKNIG